MKRFEFGAFHVDDSNRAAFEICHAIAELQPVSPLPVVILAEPGRGKTHLLYAIVSELREKSPRTALAYITAREFPDKARGLIEDPTPIERASSAVLLVDQLDQFTERLVDLEAIVRAFLDRGHYVVLASCLPPARLVHLPAGLRAMLGQGQVIRVASETDIPAMAAPISTAETKAERGIVPPSDEIRRLREELARLEEKASALPSVSDLERHLDRERERCRALQEQAESQRAAEEDLAQELEHARTETRTLHRALDTAREEAQTLRDDLERARGEAQTLQRKSDTAREEAQALQHALDSAREEAQTLRNDLERARNEAQSLRHELDSARDEGARVVVLEEEVKRLTSHADHLHAEQEANDRVRASVVAQLAEKSTVEEELHAARIQLQIAEEQRAARDADWAKHLEVLLAGLEERKGRSVQAIAMAGERVRLLEEAVASARSAAGNAPPAESALRMRTAYEARIAELQESAHRAKEEAVAELRHRLEEQSTQLAALQADREELDRLRNALDFSRGSGQVVAAGIQNLREQIAQTADALGTLAERTRQACDAETATPKPEEDPWDGPNEEL